MYLEDKKTGETVEEGFVDFIPSKKVPKWISAMLDGARLIEQHGMCQFQEHEIATGKYCFIGAVVAAGGEEVRRECYDQAEKFLGFNPVNYNNEFGRKSEEVVTMMRRCAMNSLFK